MNSRTALPSAGSQTPSVAWAVLLSISLGHLCNDSVQALLPAIYPLLKASLRLDYTQVGLIALAFHLTASLLQPFVGGTTDRLPQPYSLVAGMLLSLAGVLLFSLSHTFEIVLFSATLIGLGSSIFHPEASRLAGMASGGRHGFAQSVFQVGGNAGSALGPLLAALIITRGGQSRIGWFVLLPLAGLILLWRVGRWHRAHLDRLRADPPPGRAGTAAAGDRRQVALAASVLVALIVAKYLYLTSIASYYMFYLISRFHLSVRDGQLHLFLFLVSVAAGTMLGGPVSDRIGRKNAIRASILGAAPFTLLLPHANLFWCSVLSVVIGVVLSSAFSAILVCAQELMPDRIGLVSGVFFGLKFGVGGIGAALLGRLADHSGIASVVQLCAFLPLVGLLTFLLPDDTKTPGRAAPA